MSDTRVAVVYDEGSGRRFLVDLDSGERIDADPRVVEAYERILVERNEYARKVYEGRLR